MNRFATRQRYAQLALAMFNEHDSVVDSCAAKEVMGFKVVDCEGFRRLLSGGLWSPDWKVRPHEATWWDPYRHNAVEFGDWKPTAFWRDCVRVHDAVFLDRPFPDPCGYCPGTY